MKVFQIKSLVQVDQLSESVAWREKDERDETYVKKITEKLINYFYQLLSDELKLLFEAESINVINSKSDNKIILLLGVLNPTETVIEDINKQISITTSEFIKLIQQVPSIFDQILSISEYEPHQVLLCKKNKKINNYCVEVESDYLRSLVNLFRKTTVNNVRKLSIKISGFDWINIDASNVAIKPKIFEDDEVYEVFGEIVCLNDMDFTAKILGENNKKITDICWQNMQSSRDEISNCFHHKHHVKITGHFEKKIIAGEASNKKFMAKEFLKIGPSLPI
ncbi:MAG: hypothetical protein HOE12_14290 [Gammaproteobacteria bacterium]|nr:hypothetical protein [Gammaproteobacteria bacterium]